MRARHRSPGRSDLLLLGATVAMIGAVVAAIVRPPEPGLAERARGLESQLRCPTCQGLSIADSPATAAVQMRSVIEEQLGAGRSDEEVRAFFTARYGRWILLDPPASGVDVALWLVPPAIAAGGAILVARRARRPAVPGHRPSERRWRARPPPAVSRAASIALGAVVVGALVAPIMISAGLRQTGQEVTGGPPRPAPASVGELEAFVRARPEDVEALVMLGDALLDAGRADEAAARYRSALELDPSNVEALLGIGAILVLAGRPGAAGPLFDRILRIVPDQPDALLLRAVARIATDGPGDPRAMADLRRFVQDVQLSDGRRAQALAMLRRGGAARDGGAGGAGFRSLPGIR